jgi:ornithine cyclodeaminase/alanine dehydrogenase-like protein (mu-crystallin family)
VLVLSNEEIARLFGVEDCMAALEPMYRDLAEERALMSPRVDNIAPTTHPGGYYAFKHMGGTWPAQGIQALRINSDVVTHPVIAGKPRRQKQPLAPGGRWVGLVLLFSTQTGALLAMFPDGVVQRLRVGAASGLALKHLARSDAATLALIGSGWQAGAQLAAALAARPLKEVRVWSPRKEAGTLLSLNPGRSILRSSPAIRSSAASTAPTSSPPRPRRWCASSSRSGSSPACTSAASRPTKSTARCSIAAAGVCCTTRSRRSSSITS